MIMQGIKYNQCCGFPNSFIFNLLIKSTAAATPHPCWTIFIKNLFRNSIFDTLIFCVICLISNSSVKPHRIRIIAISAVFHIFFRISVFDTILPHFFNLFLYYITFTFILQELTEISPTVFTFYIYLAYIIH